MSRLSSLEEPAYTRDEGAEGSPRRMTEIRHEELHAKYIRYLRLGWSAFKNEDYPEASMLFDSARAIAPEEPDALFGKLFASFANQRWRTALKSLQALLQDETYDMAAMMVRYGDARSVYYASPEKFNEHASLLSRMAIGQVSGGKLNALQAFITWFRGDYKEAQSIADFVYRFAADSEWGRLSAVIARATRLKTEQGASAASPE